MPRKVVYYGNFLGISGYRGSNSSIPELLRQQALRSRPVSANVPSRTRPWSGKKSRPKSAVNLKPPLPSGRPEVDIKVKGSKFDPETRKQILPVVSVEGWTESSSNDGTVPPHDDSDQHDDKDSPNGLSDDEEPNDDIKKTNTKQSPPLLLRRPTPEALHLQLPTVDNDDDDDDEDELDTDRLLERAAINSHRNSSLTLQFLQGSLESLHSLATTEDPKNFSDLDELRANLRSEVIEKVVCEDGEGGLSGISSHTDDNNSNMEPARSPSVLIREDRNMIFDISPRLTDNNSRPVSASRKRPDYKHVQSRINSGIDKSLLHSRKSCLKQTSNESLESSDPLPISVSKISCNPSKTVSMVTKESSAKEMPFTQNKDGEKRSSALQRSRPRSALRSKPQSDLSPSRLIQEQKPVAVVTVDYGEERTSTINNSSKTVASELLSGKESSPSVLLNTPENKMRVRPTSAKSVNYYEQAVKQKEDINMVYKTTKTFEFGPDGPKEASIRSAIDGQLLKPTEPLAVSDEQLKRSRQSRPPSVRRPVKPKPSSPQVEVETPSTEDLLQSLTTHIQVSIKTPSSIRDKTQATPITSTAVSKVKNTSPKVAFFKTTSSTTKPTTVKLENEISNVPVSKPAQTTKTSVPLLYSRSISAKQEKTPPILTDVNYITSRNRKEDVITEERSACQDLTDRLAQSGVNVAPETLERALYPPNGRTLYYDVPGYLPQSSSTNLLSHPKVWIPEQYKRFKEAEKQLERAEHIMWLQKKQEERDQKAASGKPVSAKKRKKRGKKLFKRSQTFS
ncbi:uncharacterized protein LOC126808476 isoform X2 [Patella vulgata]|uniref:uncharacterized protein LOC126808476 isoform X2 n=1 Tax=Patella vulgata TaxID=6465 RepID=UPI0021808F8A|nr:uncharacterized protein LOC126808476 isoform X2 [Patella vulgata]